MNNVVVNLKFPIMPVQPMVPRNRDSLSSINSANRRPPPGFEENGSHDGNGFPASQAQNPSGFKKHDRTLSPPINKSGSKLVRKRPTSTKSTQNCIVPLVTESETDNEKKRIHKYLNEISSKGKNESDSISDEVDRLPIKEEDEDDSVDEEQKNVPLSLQKSLSLQGQNATKSSFIPPPNNPRNSDNQLFTSPQYFGEQGYKYDGTPGLVMPGPEKSVQSIYEYKGHVATLAMTQQGSKYLQRVLTKASPDVVEFILQEIGMKLSNLMTDQYGNYF
jgi:hypothetical protein